MKISTTNILLDAPLAISKPLLSIPHYLQMHYWWAYIHPLAVHIFERQWLVNLILWGNYTPLCNAVLDSYKHKLPGLTLQIACAYGDLTPRLAACVAPGGQLGVVDILQIQLDNLARKLPQGAPVKLQQMDSSVLELSDASVNQALLFFLLHEQPEMVRKKTLSEALRVIRPGGTLTIVDYAVPNRYNLLRYLWCPFLKILEPFASDLFHKPISAWLPNKCGVTVIKEQRFFGGLYQMLILQCDEISHNQHMVE